MNIQNGLKLKLKPRANLPDKINEPVLLELEEFYQINHCWKRCWKYRNEECRFHFGKFITIRIIIAQTLNDHIPQDVRHEKMPRRNAILKKVKSYTHDKLNPSKKTFFDNTKDDYFELQSSDENLAFSKN